MRSFNFNVYFGLALYALFLKRLVLYYSFLFALLSSKLYSCCIVALYVIYYDYVNHKFCCIIRDEQHSSVHLAYHCFRFINFNHSAK